MAYKKNCRLEDGLCIMVERLQNAGIDLKEYLVLDTLNTRQTHNSFIKKVQKFENKKL